jgi:hypothetical protein
MHHEILGGEQLTGFGIPDFIRSRARCQALLRDVKTSRPRLRPRPFGIRERCARVTPNRVAASATVIAPR